GYRVSGLEGFARTAPLLGAWLYSGRSRMVAAPSSNHTIDLLDLLRGAILAGTTPSSSSYWGKMTDNDQRIVEAADIARLLWLTPDQIWFGLTEDERARVANWLSQVNGVEITYHNNWVLFPVVVNAFLESVGYTNGGGGDAYDDFKRNYLEEGWFRDGPT